MARILLRIISLRSADIEAGKVIERNKKLSISKQADRGQGYLNSNLCNNQHGVATLAAATATAAAAAKLCAKAVCKALVKLAKLLRAGSTLSLPGLLGVLLLLLLLLLFTVAAGTSTIFFRSSVTPSDHSEGGRGVDVVVVVVVGLLLRVQCADTFVFVFVLEDSKSF